jgi:hypothetical protein
MRRRYAVLITAVIVGGCILAGVLLTLPGPPRTSAILGAVLIQNSDARKQSPIPDAQITATAGISTGSTQSDSTGFFRLNLKPAVRRGELVTLSFQHSGYEPLQLTQAAEGQIVLAYMTPLPKKTEEQPAGPENTLSDLRIRYSLNTEISQDVGSKSDTFEVVNTNGVPCNGRSPCSPDGKWKAAQRSVSFDAGQKSAFREVRLSCIAGPCPFTKIQSEGLSDQDRVFSATVLNWSDTTTFLFEAEVVQRKPVSLERISYPVEFGETLDFTLPGTAEGPSIEASVNGSDPIVFPLGPELILPWAACTVKVQPDSSKLFTCQLNHNYKFK